MIEKLLSEEKVLSTEEIHGRMVDKKFCPSRQHLGVILSSLTTVTSEDSYNDDRGAALNLWRLKNETPTDN
jgi:hypothetical protein